MAELWVPVEEFANHLGIAKDSVYWWIGRKDRPVPRMGRLWKVDAVTELGLKSRIRDRVVREAVLP